MRFWEENRKLVIGTGAALLLLLILSPSLLGLGPVVTRFQRGAFVSAETERENLQRKINELYNTNGELTSTVNSAVTELNEQLSYERETLRKTAAMIDYKPFRITEERSRGPKAMIIRDAVRIERIRHASLRNVSVSENAEFFGFQAEIESGVPPEDEETIAEWMLQLAAIDQIFKMAVDARVDIETIERLPYFDRGAIVPEPPAENADPKTAAKQYKFYPLFIRYHPIHFKVLGSLDSLVTFLHSLDGLHGHLLGSEKATDPQTGEEQLVVTIDLGTQHGLSEDVQDIEAIDQFAIFGHEKYQNDPYVYKGRTSRLVSIDDTQSTWIVPKHSLLQEDIDLNDPSAEAIASIREGDNVSSRFFSVLDVSVTSREPDMAKNSDGKMEPTPARLEVDVWAAAVTFLDDPNPSGSSAGAARPSESGTAQARPRKSSPPIDTQHLGY